MIFKKIRKMIKLNKQQRLEQMVEERVQLREFNGQLYIAIDGVPMQCLCTDTRNVVETLNVVRNTVKLYLQRNEYDREKAGRDMPCNVDAGE